MQADHSEVHEACSCPAAQRTEVEHFLAQSRGRYLGLRFLASERSLLSTALRVLHHRTQDTAGDPCGSHKVSYRSYSKPLCNTWFLTIVSKPFQLHTGSDYLARVAERSFVG